MERGRFYLLFTSPSIHQELRSIPLSLEKTKGEIVIMSDLARFVAASIRDRAVEEALEENDRLQQQVRRLEQQVHELHYRYEYTISFTGPSASLKYFEHTGSRAELGADVALAEITVAEMEHGFCTPDQLLEAEQHVDGVRQLCLREARGHRLYTSSVEEDTDSFLRVCLHLGDGWELECDFTMHGMSGLELSHLFFDDPYCSNKIEMYPENLSLEDVHNLCRSATRAMEIERTHLFYRLW